MTRTTIGWVFVAVQGLLLIGLVLLPSGDDWATPRWLTTLGGTLTLSGLAIVAIASLRLGAALTATPVPAERGRLTTTGLYRYVRHPIYTGVLTIVAGLTVRSGNSSTLVLAVVTAVFFNYKARWEETHLAERYESYADYAASTPRFVPRPWRSSRIR